MAILQWTPGEIRQLVFCMFDFATYLRYLRLMEEMLQQDLQALMMTRNRHLGLFIGLVGRKYWFILGMMYKLLQ